MPKPVYETVATFPSSRVQKNGLTKFYEVKRRVDTGAISCSCPVYVFNQKGDRTCYHTMRYQVMHDTPSVAPVKATAIRELPRKLKLIEGGS